SDVCSSDLTTVNISLSEELCCVSCVYGTAVLDTDRFCSRLVINLSDTLTDTLAHFFSLLCCSSLSCSDRPDRLVSNYHCLRLICCYILKTYLHLLADKVHCHALLSLLQRLAAAHDRCDAMLKLFKDFLV